MMKPILAYFVTAIVFLVLDLLWLGSVAQQFYADQLGDLMADPFNLKAAALFYVLYILGIQIFAVAGNTPRRSLLRGALFGFFCYMTYEITNLAVITNWPSSLPIVDIAWGTFVTGFAAWCGSFALSKLR